LVTEIWTIGHSTRSIEDFVATLEANAIKLVADVRLLPGSRRYPQFNQDALAESLGKYDIKYTHFPELGGRRRPLPDSHNIAWRNEAFRGYADYMETKPFHAGLERLLRRAQQSGRTAIMCAEVLWWRCHRSLIADFLKVRGVTVRHISYGRPAEPHPFTSAASVSEGKLSYRGSET
jgi:uncharacterized protein (DUF488 family)